jgi:hypothetical protein
MKEPPSAQWKNQSDEHDYVAAASYLSLLVDPKTAKQTAASFKKSPISKYLAKDLLRASRLPLLQAENCHVKADLKKVKKGDQLSPILLVRGDLENDQPLVIADGYHRVCASYYLDENAEVLCHLVDLKPGATR